MGSSLEDFALEALSALVGHEDVNALLIDKLVKRGRNRPHPWSTRYDYICWSGLTDRSFNARLLPARPYPAAEATGTRRPPKEEVAKLYREEHVNPMSGCLWSIVPLIVLFMLYRVIRLPGGA